LTIGLFLVLFAAYGAKAYLHPAKVRAEINHPVMMSFFLTLSISLILIGTCLTTWVPEIAVVVWTFGAVGQLLLTLLILTRWVHQEHFEIHHISPAWFIPVVGNILVPLAGVQYAQMEVSWFFFSIGILFWVVLLTIIMYRIIFHQPIDQNLLPTLFILIAPPAAGFVAYLNVAGELDNFGRFLYYSALFLTLLLFTQVRRFLRLPFGRLTHTIAHRVGRFLERQGLLERDAENSYLASDAVDDDPMTPLLGHSITCRIAVGPQAGRKVFTLQTLPASDELFDDGAGKMARFSLHAGVAARADERKKLERVCRYISRPAVSEQRLSLTPNGNVRYQLKTPYRDGTTHVIFEPLDFIARLAALVPKPRVNLTRFHGVFAPNSKHRALVTPAKRGRGNQARVVEERPSPAERRASMTWAQRLKRVFNIDIETCSVCGGAMKVIACIEDPVVIKQILDHLEHKAEASEP
jgi:hypothetical protein